MSLTDEKVTGLEIDILSINNKLKEMSNPNGITVTHLSDRYRLVIERAASTKGVDGFKVEANGTDFNEVTEQVAALYNFAKEQTKIEEV